MSPMATSSPAKRSTMTNAQGKTLLIISCHHMKLNTLSPPLGNMFGKTAGSVQGFLYYSPKCRSLGYRWSKQKLYKLLGSWLFMLR